MYTLLLEYTHTQSALTIWKMSYLRLKNVLIELNARFHYSN